MLLIISRDIFQWIRPVFRNGTGLFLDEMRGRVRHGRPNFVLVKKRFYNQCFLYVIRYNLINFETFAW